MAKLKIDKPKALPGGFPNFKRHLAAIHRMPPTHSEPRKFHASDVIYSMLRKNVGSSLMRRAGSGPAQESVLAEKAKKATGKKLTSNSMWASSLKKPR